MIKQITFLIFLILASVCFAEQPQQSVVCQTVDMNITSDQTLNFSSFKNVIIRRVTVTAATISLTKAAGGIYTGANKTGIQIVSPKQSYSTLTSPDRFVDLTLQDSSLNTVLNAQSVFFSLTTPQGSTATARVCIYGDQIN